MTTNRQTFNYHTHTFRCGHAEIRDDEDYVKSAIKAGFKTLGFSDHGPYKNYSKKGDRMDYDEMQGYLDSINSLKKKYEKQIRILTGFEFEYFDELSDELEELSKVSDYLILGQHYPDPTAVTDYCLNCGDHDNLLKYSYLVRKGMNTGKFIYLAHPDYFCGSIYDFDDDCVRISKEICAEAEKTNTPLEVNIKLQKRKPREYSCGNVVMYPFYKFWEIAQDYDIKAVYGFDAHDPEILEDMDNYTKADRILEGLNISFIKDELI